MCRMIGFAASEPIAIGPFLRELARQSLEGCRPPGCDRPHEDGFGIALFRNGHWLLVHEQCAVWEGPLDGLGKLTGTIAVLHSRMATDETTINFTKLHPFRARAGGSDLVFCHNGSIYGHERLFPAAGLPADTDPKDVIDTQAYFAMVCAEFGEGRGMLDALPAAAEQIYATVGAHDARSLNALISDGRSLVAYKGHVLDANRGYHTLFTTRAAGVAVVSTQVYGLPGAGTWHPVEGAQTVSPG